MAIQNNHYTANFLKKNYNCYDVNNLLCKINGYYYCRNHIEHLDKQNPIFVIFSFTTRATLLTMQKCRKRPFGLNVEHTFNLLLQNHQFHGF